MELKATSLGKRLAQHPYDRVVILNAGVKVSGDRHEYLIPFNQLLAIECKRGLVWGELEFVLADNKVVRLHGTEWNETQRFYQHLNERWVAWSTEMSEVAAGCSPNNSRTFPDVWIRKNGSLARSLKVFSNSFARRSMRCLSPPAALNLLLTAGTCGGNVRPG
jgi:hypothetical protein